MAKAVEAIPFAGDSITNWHIQKMKDEGKKITMVGTAMCDPLWVCACERAGVDIVRYVGPGEDIDERTYNMVSHTKIIRQLAPNINLNAVMHTPEHPDNSKALERAGRLLSDGADSVMIMAITNDMMKYLSDNRIPVFGHVGCLSGWQTGWYGGYSRVGKTAEDAMDIFRMAYEYQENGMMGMTIELTAREVTDIIAKKLRVPVISVAAGGSADGSEMVIFDLLGLMPTSLMPKHAKYYRTFFEDGIKAFSEFGTDVKNKVYPAEEHGWGMEEREFDKFVNTVEQKYPNVK
jgi:3-methyl-2-oxobutanoate hydroxymethyltransferase